MSASPADPVQLLSSTLREGTGGHEADKALLARMGLEPDSGDVALARELVKRMVAARAASLRTGPVTPRPNEAGSAPVVDGRASYLVRLGTDTDDPARDIARMEDLRTLMAVVRAGTLRQRRAAVLRLGELLVARESRGAPARAAMELLKNLRKIDVAYELSKVCADLPGADGRRARAGRREWDALQEHILQRILGFWDGQINAEPIHALPADQRIQLLVRCRDLADPIVSHICAVLEDADGVSDRTARRALCATLRNAGDARLVPSLRWLVDGPDKDLVIDAARALATIDDRRVHGVLRARYDRTADAELRMVIAGALAMVGDTRGLDHARAALIGSDEGLLPYGLEALAALGTCDDVQTVAERLDHGDPTVVRAGVETLERIGDGRALTPLRRLADATDRSGLRAAAEEALAAVEARMELLGEDATERPDATLSFDTAKLAVRRRRRDPAGVPIRARWAHWMGHVWLFLGALGRAVARFEEAAALRPEWVAPVVSVAMAYARKGLHAQALATFRRALEIDRDRVEENAYVVRMLAQAFLRRAETVERDGRGDIAFGLLEEALSLDLRKAPSGLRFALGQRHEALRTRAI